MTCVTNIKTMNDSFLACPVCPSRKYNQISLLQTPLYSSHLDKLCIGAMLLQISTVSQRTLETNQTESITFAQLLLTRAKRRTHSRLSEHWSLELTEQHTSYTRATSTINHSLVTSMLFVRTSSCARSFSVAAPTICNSLSPPNVYQP